ncbi:MAG TPA: glycosyltransferase family 39 protein, partial [Isosphaeraceae bacterium]|nr:glycosyltransferase family 39 protein [Isosphaeraceae bacterium]
SSPAALVNLLGQIDGTRAPLHPLLLQGWLRLFGSSELAGRSFSALCGILTVLVAFMLGRRFFDDATGRWAAWFAAVCPPLVYYSQEARMYAWLVLVTCLSWLVFGEFRRWAGGITRLLYGTLLAALVYSHPVGLFMVAAHGLAYLIVRGSLQLRFRSWLVIQLGVLIAIAPWVPRYLDHGTDYPLPRYTIRFLFAVPIEYIGGNSAALLVCVLIIGMGFVARKDLHLNLDLRVENLILLVWLTAVPVLMYTYSWIFRPIFGPPRYHLFIAPAYLILLARGLCKLTWPLRWTLAAGALWLSLQMIDANVYSQVVKADWRGLARWLNQERALQDAASADAPVTIAVHPSDARFPQDEIHAARYYLDDRHRVVPADRTGGDEVGKAHTPALEVYCLSAAQVRAGVREFPDTSFPAPLWQRATTSRHHELPEFYGLIVRRR